MKNFDPSNIRILEVRTLNFAADSTAIRGKIVSPDDVKQFDYKVGYILGINEKEEVVRIAIDIEVLAHVKGLKKTRKLGKIVTETFFYLLDFEDWLTERENQPGMRLDDHMASILVGLAFSTTRGILIARASGTILENAILPVIAPAKLSESQPDQE